MFKTTIEPRFSETDSLGHINHTVFPVWFNDARKDLFKLIHPSLTPKDWPVILAHINVDFFHQAHYETNVLINTGVTKIGTKSFTVVHEAWQQDTLIARGEAVMVWYDYQQQESGAIPEEIKSLLAKH